MKQIYQFANSHINWIWIIFTLLQFAVIPFESVIPFLIARVLWIIVTIWALWAKNRNIAWMIIPISVLFLENKRSIGK